MGRGKGDLFTTLNFLIMGIGCMARGQIAKGLLLLFTQLSYIYFMLTFGIGYLADFGTLGTVEQSRRWNNELEINEIIRGDNSLLILLFSVLTIVISIVFIYIYIINIYLGFKAFKLKNEGKQIPNFRDDLRILWNDKYHVVLLTLPAIGIIAFTILPQIFMVAMAFTNFDRDHLPPGNLFTWVGFENFKEILWSHPRKSHTFFEVFKWTLTWAVLSTATCYLGGITLAMLINRKGVRLKSMWRAFFAVTIAVPQFVSLLLMRQLLNESGTLNYLLQYWGLIEQPIMFLGADLARFMVIVVNFWVGVPYTLLIATAVLTNIPAEIYESAKIDGAGPFLIFRKLTMPYMLFVTTPYLITQFTGNVNNFNVIYLLTGGGPNTLAFFQAGKTEILITWLYRQTLDEQNYNLASTIGIVIFSVLAIISLFLFNTYASKKTEEDFL